MRLRPCLALACGLLLLPAARADESAAPRPATWQHQQFTLDYRGFTTHYSCDGLRAKLRQVLQALGARKDDLKVTPANCTRMADRPELMPSMDVDIWTLRPAPVPPPADALPAHWQALNLSRQLDGDDCELAEEIQRQVLPHFAVRQLQLSTGCIPHQARGSIGFTLEALAAAPVP
jgi:hypothetical protein